MTYLIADITFYKVDEDGEEVDDSFEEISNA